MKVFVDDFRDCPEGWTAARSVSEAIHLLATRNVTEVSLDHDIRTCSNKRCNNRNETFMPVAEYIALMRPRPIVRIHTGNVTMGQVMAHLLSIPYNNEIYDPQNYV